MDNKIKIGEKIRLLRKKNDVTQDKLAYYLGVTPQAVSKWERELSCPDIILLPEIARVLGVTVSYLLGADS